MNFSIKVPNIKYRKSQKLYFLPHSNSRGIFHKIYPKNNRKTAFSHQTPHSTQSNISHFSCITLHKPILITTLCSMAQISRASYNTYLRIHIRAIHIPTPAPQIFPNHTPTLLILKPYINSPQKPIFYET